MHDFLMFLSGIVIAVVVFLVLAHRAQPGWWKDE